MVKQRKGQGGYAKDGLGAAAAGGASHKSLKNQIRSARRLLGKLSQSDDPEAAQKCAGLKTRIAKLEARRADVQRSEHERKIAVKYRRVRFFERRKLLRKIKAQQRKLNSLHAVAGSQHPDEAPIRAKLSQLEADMDYIVFFPPGVKYVSLFKSTTPEAAEQREKLRKLAMQHKQKMQAGGITTEEMDRNEFGGEAGYSARTEEVQQEAEASAPVKKVKASAPVNKAKKGEPVNKAKKAKPTTQPKQVQVVDDSNSGDESDIEHDDFFLSTGSAIKTEPARFQVGSRIAAAALAAAESSSSSSDSDSDSDSSSSSPEEQPAAPKKRKPEARPQAAAARPRKRGRS